MYLVSKTICYKPYEDLYLLPILTYCEKDFLIDFVTNLQLFTN